MQIVYVSIITEANGIRVIIIDGISQFSSGRVQVLDGRLKERLDRRSIQRENETFRSH